MRAAILHEYGQSLRLEEAGRPTPGPGEVLLRVEACGVCHSDLHLARGDWPQLQKIVRKPLILGHEVVGRVLECGPGVGDPERGARVGVPWIHWTCGECEHCRENHENLCLSQSITGVTVDGGFAELIKAKAGHVIRIPDNMDSFEAAPFLCAGVTVYRAVRRAGIGAGHRVAVFGIGGLGHMAVQVARHFGATVYAVDITGEKLRLAKELGALEAWDGGSRELRRQFRAAGGMHFAVVTSASREAYDAAFASLRRGGTVVVVGAPAEDLRVSAISMVGGEYSMLASAVGTRRDVREVLELASAGKLTCRQQTRPLDRVNEVFEDMRRGAIPGRVVLQP